ncbi:MAG: hypothetical protein A2283_01745 [Lentisphaerae bacterium RIFOXYA12_FULL_48_11]|nr:MAG: hypothetical protein A2283_01745 [Lentisphaerae bacterium RIFOXYA12_FULL_48_11]
MKSIIVAMGFSMAASVTSGLELIGDPHGERGVAVLNLNEPEKTAAVLRLRESTDVPVWTLAEWDSKETIAGVESEVLSSGAKRWKNRMKEFIMGADTTDADFVLMVDSIQEYGDTYRKGGQTPWPHLLLGQKICSPGGHCESGAPSLADIDSILFSINVRMRHALNVHAAERGYSPKIHAAHVMMYLTVQNLNRKRAKGYGDYYWFGITFYDDRHEVPSVYAMPDSGGDPSKGEKKGTGKFIYNVGLAPFSDTGLVPGCDWRPLSGDIYPIIIEGLNAAWKKNFLTDSKSLSDYKIGGVNIGWEVPGLSQVSFQFRNLSVRAYGPSLPEKIESKGLKKAGG